MENLHREEKGGQHFRRGNDRSQALEADINLLLQRTDGRRRSKEWFR